MCQRQLVEFQRNYGKILGLKAEIIAISADNALEMNKTTRELGIRYLLISDPKKRIIKDFGVLHPREGIARPATFIIDKNGMVRYVHVGNYPSDRPTVQQVMQALAFL
ncbi:MAG: peroxiredoxin family protein [Nitrospinae bacterium]|nr:peroxiredoxin family protein [Nitrospinota bacterium]